MNIPALILQIVNAANISGRDAEAIVAAKQWLQKIQRGELVVGAPVTEPKTDRETPQ